MPSLRATSSAFNSLFEMPWDLGQALVTWHMYASNSLFEMPCSSAASYTSLCRPFNSLFEMQNTASGAAFMNWRNFQFSI